MTKDNSTGKNKDFYELGKKMFDRLNPHIAHNPKVVGYVAPQRTWVGLTEEERKEIWNVGEKKDQAWRALLIQTIRDVETKLKERNT